MLKPPRIIQRTLQPDVYAAAQNLGLSELQSRLVAQRLDTTDGLEAIVFPKLKHLQHPNELKNAQQAAELIANAIQGTGLIVLATDYDTDGVTSAWVAYHALTEHFGVPAQRVVHLIGERKSGYGISDDTVERILQLKQPIDLVITADQGSSDEPRIKRLAEAGIPVCVTDHHQMPTEGVPRSAACTVNPQQDGCDYDKTVAGCFVIFLVMSQVRQVLIQRGVLTEDSPSLRSLAIHVALGTIADSVSLKSPNNRAIVVSGLQQINQFTHPAWQAVRQLNDNQGRPFNAEFLAFQVATRINAASRVSDVTTAFHFLNAVNQAEATRYLQQLDADNQQRRDQQQAMLEQAMEKAAEQYHAQRFSLAIALEGNAGIQGIIATRVGEKFGVPCVAMTDLNDGTLAGSGRGVVPELDLRLAFQWMEDQHPGMFISMGGHKGAAGCQIPIELYPQFHALFEAAVQMQLGDTPPSPLIETDGELSAQDLTTSLIDMIAQLEPFGREWPQPQFSGRFKVIDIKCVGQNKTHLSLSLLAENAKLPIKAIYFNALESASQTLPFDRHDSIDCVYQPSLNTFMDRSSLQLRLQWAQKSNA